jgi:PPOX class probable F420-dependent enzyme
MDLDDARAFVREHSHAVLTTTRRDGTPQMSPVAAGVDAQGAVVVSSRETAYKTRNLRRDPRAWLCVLPDGFYGSWIQVEGTVEVLSCPRRWSRWSTTTARWPASTTTGRPTAPRWRPSSAACSGSR